MRNQKRVIITAFVLGAAALILNLCSYSLLEQFQLPIGNLLIFWCAALYGTSGGLVAVAASVIPEALYFGDPIYGLRIFLLTLAIGSCAESAPKLPSYLVGAVLWGILFGPALYLLSAYHVTPVLWPTSRIILTGVSEIFLIATSSTLLMIPSIWGRFATHPRHIEREYALMHLFSITSLGLALAMLVLPHNSVSAFETFWSAHHNPTLLPLLALLAIIVPSLAARRISPLLPELTATPGKAAEKGHLFSGLSSEYWRRISQAADNLDQELQTYPHQSDRTARPSEDPTCPGICALSRDGTVAFMNQVFRSLACIVHNEVLGKKIETLGTPPELLQAIQKSLQEITSHGPQVREVRLDQGPQGLKFLQLSCSTEQTGERSPSNGIILTLTDITDRRTIESHVLQSQKLKSLGSAIRGLVHTFTNTFTTIIGHASLALDSSDSQAMERSLRELLQAATDASRLVTCLQTFAEERDNQMKREDLAGLVKSHLELIRKLLNDKHEVRFEATERKLPVRCDQNLVIQALTHLVLNSKEAYAQAGGTIEISLDLEEITEESSRLHLSSRPGKFARLRVRDHGCGMNSDVLRHAFEPLYTTKHSTAEAGLGLPIVFAIVRTHDGFLTAESILGKGTTISLYLPLLEESGSFKVESQKLQVPTETSSTGAAASQKILVVEDEASLRQLLCLMLSSLGYQVKGCADGASALELCSAQKFDLVLADVMMPKMDGHDLLKRLKQSSSPPKTLLMSGYGSQIAQPKNGTELIAKPFEMETLAATVREVLES